MRSPASTICETCGSDHAFPFKGKRICESCLIDRDTVKEWTGGMPLPELTAADRRETRAQFDCVVAHSNFESGAAGSERRYD